MILGNHGAQDIGDKLEAGASGGTMVVGAEWKVASGEFGGELGVFEAKFIEAGFVAKDGDIVIKAFDVREIPGVIEEIAVAESVFEAIGGETGYVIIGDGEEFVIGDFAGENAVFFELTSDDAGITNDIASASFDGFLVFGIAVEIINGVLEAGAGDVVEETGESLDFVMGEIPDDEGDADAMGKD